MAAQPFHVRVAEASDAARLAPLCAAHAAYEQLPPADLRHAARLHAALASGQLHAWLLYREAQAVGYASATLDYATLSGRSYAHLDCLYLHAEVRGQGGGRALLHAVIAFARSRGCAELQWQTPAWNARAIDFYDRQGAQRLLKQRYCLDLTAVHTAVPS